MRVAQQQFNFKLASGLYYKHIMIVNDAASKCYSLIKDFAMRMMFDQIAARPIYF